MREIVEILRRNYCGKVGLEYMHINDLEERRFLQDRMEGKDAEIVFTPEGKQSILTKVVQAEQWEKFLARKYVGTKRFGLDGGESMVPALEAVIKYGGQYGVDSMVVGMAHRGRLNVLANVMGKPYRAIFSEFAGGAANPEDVGGSGDVKYHLGTSSDREFDGIKRPSQPRAQSQPSRSGRSGRARQGQGPAGRARRRRGRQRAAGAAPRRRRLRRAGDRRRMPRLLRHSRLLDRRLPPFHHQQPGRLHHLARSSPAPRLIRRTSPRRVQAPILHVNGDDPEAVTFACKLAIEYRQKFNRDIVIDMWCYRRFGHNEGDEPSFTQPLMYQE